MTKVVGLDWAIKNLLRDKANFCVLEGFFYALLGEEIVVQELLAGEHDPTSEYNRENRISVLTKDKRDKLTLILLQVEREDRFFHRLVYNSSKLAAQYVKEHKSHGSVEKIISISITYLGPGEGTDYVYHGSTNFVGMNQQDTLQATNIQKTLYGIDDVHEIFVEHYLLQLENFDGHVGCPLDEWIYMMQYDQVKSDFTSRHIQDAAEKLKYTNLEQIERQRYDRYRENLHYQASMEETRRIDMEMAIAEGREEGQHAEKITIARKLLQIGMSASQIAEVNGLPEEEIEQLKNE